VDEIKDIINNSKQWLANYQAELINNTNIAILKIKYTNLG
jgi:DNA mismatch repair ATPase MutS